MKKITFACICFMLVMPLLHSAITDYYDAPVETSGTYEPITGGSYSGVSGDDAISGILPIGFTFSYCGTDYTTFKVDTNGYLNLGGDFSSSNLSNDMAGSYPVIAPLWDDLSTGSLYYVTTGTPGARVLTVQWANVRWNYQGSSVQNFQVKLYENTNQIQFIYGYMATPSSASATIGINCPTGGLENFYSIIPGSPMSYSTTSSYNIISSISYLYNGLTYTFNEAIASVPPNPAVCVSPSDTELNVSPLTALNWASGGGHPVGYSLFIGTDNPPTNLVNGVDLLSSTTFDPEGDLVINTTYYWQVVPYNSFGTATGCPVWSFTTLDGAPGLTNPAHGATGELVNAVEIRFNPVPGASGYFLNMGTIPGGTDIFSHTDVTSAWTLTSILSFNTTYYWSVFSVFPGQEIQSSEWSFTTSIGMPSDPNPYDTMTGLDVINTSLDWADVPGAGFYTITIGTSPGGSNIASNVVCTGSSYTHPTNWGFNTTYYWSVIMHASGDTYQISGPEWTFTTGDAVVNMHTGSCNVPEGVTYHFYDSGGASYSYSNYENSVFTFNPLPGRSLIVIFDYFETEGGYDYLRVYDGPSTYYPALHLGYGYNGGYRPGTITSTGALTFTFNTDSSVAYSGWSATIINSDFGLINGTVTTGGYPVSGAVVAINTLSLSQPTTTEGTFSFSRIRAGSYTLNVSKVGCTSAMLDATVVADQTTIANATLTTLPAIADATVNMNSNLTTGDLSPYFIDNARYATYSVTGNTHINWYANGDNTITFTPQTGWFGAENLYIRGTDTNGDYCDKPFKITVLETWTSLEDFNHSGGLPTGWVVTHSGSTEFTWQSVLVSGTDYNAQTTALTGRNATERLTTTAYNLSTFKDVSVSFNCNFLPYGTGNGILAYTLNNLTYVTIENFTTAVNGIRTYQLPALDGKPSVKFRWSYINTTPNAGQSNYWIIDNFQVFGLVRDVTLPTQVSGLNVVSQTASTATLNWLPTSDVYFSRYEVYISTDATVTLTDRLWSVTDDSALNNGSHTQTTVTGLSNTTYWVAVRALDLSGNASALSSAISFTIDSTPPTLINPVPAGQPAPNWSNSRTVNIGCTLSDINLINQNSVMYRFDRNGNGQYDAEEVWTQYSGTFRNALTINVDVTFDTDGTHAFEFKAADQHSNIGYSGSSGIQGIGDDWVVRIDTSLPAFTHTAPPLPDWVNTRIVTISCSVSHTSQIDAGTFRFRFDRNGNGVYDATEGWTTLPARVQRQSTRDTQSFSVDVQYEADGILAYEFKVSGMNSLTGYSGTSGQEGIADDWFVRIDASAPNAITNFYVQSVADTSVELKWTASGDPHFAGYEVYYALNQNVSVSDILWNKLNDSALEFAGTGLVGTTINGLQPARRYYFLLRAIDSVENVFQYPTIINAMTTSSGLPSAPVNLTVEVIANSIYLNWDDVTTDLNDNLIEISYYEIYASDVPDFVCSSETLIDTSAISEYMLPDVADGVDRVFFRIKAISGSVRESNSNLQSGLKQIIDKQ